MLLNQVIALVKGEKPRAENAFTKAYRDAQKTEPMTGIQKVYRPQEDNPDAVMYPGSGNKVQINATSLLDHVTTSLSRLFDLTATLEFGNTEAKASIWIDGEVILPDVPVTYLLFLEKKLVDLYTFVSNLPVLDPATEWHYDSNTGVYRSDVVTTVKQKKVLRNHVKWEPVPGNDKHPAQVDTYHEDVLEGYWDTTKFSGALPADRVKELETRVRKLSDAVKSAREQANSQQVADVKVAEHIFGYLFN